MAVALSAEIWRDPRVAAVSLEARHLYIGMLIMASSSHRLAMNQKGLGAAAHADLSDQGERQRVALLFGELQWAGLVRRPFWDARRVWTCSVDYAGGSRWVGNTHRNPSTLRKPEFRHLYADPCAYCGAPAQAIDHIVPLAAGGEDDGLNFTGSCNACNAQKGVKPLLRFLLDRSVA